MRKLALLTTMAIAVLAMTAASATAATEVRNSSGTLCSQVSPAINATNVGFQSTTRNYTSGGCTVRMNGSVTIQYSPYYESVRTTCNVAFDAHIGGDGWGYADNYAYTNCSNGVTATPCAGDRYIAPPSYAGGPFGSGFVYKDAATDLNTEQCAVVAGANRWGHSSQDITTTSSLWQWADQYNTGDAFNPSASHRHRTGLVFTSAANALTITH